MITELSSTKSDLFAAGLIASTLAPIAQAQDITLGNVTDNIIGGVAGALLGSRVCSGNGKIAATAAGGIIGSMVGGNVTNGMNSVNGSSNDRTLQPTYFGSPQPAYASPVSSAAVDQYGRYVQYASQQL